MTPSERASGVSRYPAPQRARPDRDDKSRPDRDDEPRPETGSGRPGVDCRCEPTVDGDRLAVDATDCPGEGRLETVPACRETVVRKLTERDVAAVVTTTPKGERVYADDAAALLVAAGRFADLVRWHDEQLAARTLADPLWAARKATGRRGAVGRLVAEAGLAELAARADGYEGALRSSVRE